MNKTFKKTYVAVGAALTLFAALSLTLTPSIAWALTASAPLTAADGTINLPITGASSNACTSGQRLTLYDNSGVATLKCENNPTDNEGVTSVGNTGTGIVVAQGGTASPSVGLRNCSVNQILVAGSGDNDYACANQSSVTAIPAIITFTTNTPLSTGTGTIYASLSGSLGTLGPMLTPLPAGTYSNLVCRNSINTGNTTSTVELFTGPCSGTTAATGSLVATLPNSTAASTYTGSTVADSTNNCGVIEITKTASYAGGTLNCSLERTS